MAIKNGRYKDSKGVVRHFETNENMVVVDSGQKTLKQKFTEILANVQESISSKVDALFVKDITGDKTTLQTIDKTNLVNAINELKRTGGGGSGATLNVFQRTGGTWGVFTATEPTTTWDVAGFNGTEKVLDVYFKGLKLIPEQQYTVSNSGSVTLGFELKVGESVDYCISDVSFDYEELANKPDLSLKTDKQYVDTQDNSLGSQIAILESKLGITYATWLDNVDWNTLKTFNRYRMGGGANAPLGGVWYLEVNPVQDGIVFQRAKSVHGGTKGQNFERVFADGAWSSWDKTTVDTTTLVAGTNLNTINKNGVYVFNASVCTNCPTQGENTTYTLRVEKESDVVFNQTATKVWSTGITTVFVRHCANGVWSSWVQVATTSKINNVALQNGWVARGAGEYSVTVVKSGNMVSVLGVIENGTTTSGTTIFNLPDGFKPRRREVVPIIGVNTTHSMLVSTNGSCAIDTSFGTSWTSSRKFINFTIECL